MARIKPTIPASRPEPQKRAAPARQQSSRAKRNESTDSAKRPKAPRATPAAKPKLAPKVESTKLERGRFSMPAAEFKQIAVLKGRALKLGRPAKKNELLRIGLSLASLLSDETLVIALDQLQPIKSAKAKKPKPVERADS